MLDQKIPPALQEIFYYADANGMKPHEAAMVTKKHQLKTEMLWPEPLDLKRAIKIDDADLVSKDGRKDVLSELSRQIEGYLQFPPSTIFLHGLGCVASAMCKSFYIGYSGGDYLLPISLYTITSQPPSTGKSEVNRRLQTPISDAFDALNESTRLERERLKREIAKLEKDIEKESGKDADTWHLVNEYMDQLSDKEKRLREIPEWHDAYTNATIEAIEMGLDESGGMFNIVSAEADSINVVAGAAYGDRNTKANVNLLLSAWDGEKMKGGRVGRKSYKGYVRGCIAVIAQDDTLDTMLAAGSSGRGLTERFLMLSEKPRLGYRDHSKPFRFDKSVYQTYCNMVKNIVNETKVVLSFSDESELFMTNYKQRLEPTMAESGSNSHNLVTGFIGKADKQIRRIAAVLHALTNWVDGGARSTVISDDTTRWAVSIYDMLSKTFINSADYMGYVGSNTQAESLYNYILKKAAKNEFKVDINQIRSAVKNNPCFKGSRNMTDDIKASLESLQRLNHVLIDKNTIYINPRLK